MVQSGPLWTLCFYHFRCTMPTVPAAAPFTSVSACLTTFMELIAPLLAHRPGPSTCPLFSIQSVALCLSPGPRDLPEKMANCAPHSTRLLCVCPPGSVCYVHSSIPFHSFALRCFSCLRALPAFCFCVLWLARLVIFCTCSRLEYFMGLSAFS